MATATPPQSSWCSLQAGAPCDTSFGLPSYQHPTIALYIRACQTGACWGQLLRALPLLSWPGAQLGPEALQSKAHQETKRARPEGDPYHAGSHTAPVYPKCQGYRLEHVGESRHARITPSSKPLLLSQPTRDPPSKEPQGQTAQPRPPLIHLGRRLLANR